MADNTEHEAAQLLAEFFATNVLKDLQSPSPRKFLYGWEKRALAWLQEYAKRGSLEGINAWTYSYMTDGPPPWEKK